MDVLSNSLAPVFAPENAGLKVTMQNPYHSWHRSWRMRALDVMYGAAHRSWMMDVTGGCDGW